MELQEFRFPSKWAAMPAWRYDEDDDDDGDITHEESAETISFLTTTNIIHRFWRRSQAPLFQKFCAAL